MKKYSKEELAEILQKHELWLQEDPEGKRADLSYSDLSYSNLSYSDLSYSDLRGSNLRGSDLSYSNLRGSNLSDSNLRYSNLRGSNLSYSDLSDSDLSDSNLRYSDLSYSNLSGSDLSDSDLRGSNLRGSAYNTYTAGYALACPEKGAYIAFKKASGYIVELEIPADAQRSSATTRKCRASKAKVLSITTCEGNEGPKVVSSAYDPSFVYRVGETVEVTYFDPDRWHECSTGIHHFITRDEAVKY